MLKVNRERNHCLVVGRGPAVSGKVQFTIVFLDSMVSLRAPKSLYAAYLKHLSNPFARAIKDALNIAGNSPARRYVVLGSSCLHEIQESTVLNDREWAEALSNPAHKLGSSIRCEYFVSSLS